MRLETLIPSYAIVSCIKITTSNFVLRQHLGESFTKFKKGMSFVPSRFYGCKKNTNRKNSVNLRRRQRFIY